MRPVITKLLIGLAGLFGATAVLADYDGSDALICSFGHVIECDYGTECRAVTNDSVDAPDFIKLNFREEELVATTAGEDTEPDAIDNVQDLDNHLVVQGVQGSSSTDPLGWSLSINQTTGRAVMTGSGDDAGFVIFGACTTL